ncbi:MAG: O-antigen ligase family protein, partial [Candidatus Pacebacteria bacterium]|nr:O-antigen ligase family protein [Candidatus Paceibacterota bacterium]
MNSKYFLVAAIRIFLFAAVLAPFAVNMNFYYPFVGPKGLFFMACAEIAFFMWAVLAWRWKEYRPDIKNPLLIALLLFLAVISVSGAFGANFSSSFWSKFERMSGILMFFHLAAFAIVASRVLDRKNWVWIFGVSTAAAVYIGIDAVFNPLKNARGGGFIGNDSFLGTYLLFNAFFALYLFFSHGWREYRWLKIFSAAAFLAISFCLVFESTYLLTFAVKGSSDALPAGFFSDIVRNGARAAKFSLVGGLLLLGVLRLLVSAKNEVRRFTLAALALAVAAGLMGAAFVFQKDNAVYRTAITEFGKGAIGSRLVVWDIAWQSFLERPMLGWGPENFGYAFAKHFNPCLGSQECGDDLWYDRAHNIILDTMVETGMVGLVAYAVLFAAAIFTLWKAYFAKRADFAAAGVFTALFAAYFVQNLTVFDMVASYVMLYISLGFIMFLGSSRVEGAGIASLSFKPAQLIVPLIAAVLCFSVFVISPTVADKKVIDAVREPYHSPAKIDAYRNALEVSPLGIYQNRMFFSGQWLYSLREETVSSKLTNNQANSIFSYLAEELMKSCRDSAYDYQSYLALARLYNSWAIVDKSKFPLVETILNDMVAVWPQNQQAYLELVQAYFYQGRMDEAYVWAKKAEAIFPGHPVTESVLYHTGALRQE